MPFHLKRPKVVSKQLSKVNMSGLSSTQFEFTKLHKVIDSSLKL